MSDKLQRVESGDVVNAEQGQLLDRYHVYEDAFRLSVNHSKGYAYLCGKTLHALKEITPHGKFEALKLSQFPEKTRSVLGRFMQFSEAVDFRKIPTVGFLKDGQMLLTLGDRDKEKILEAVADVTGDKGIVETIHDWRKKTATKPGPVDAVKQEEEHQKNIVAIYERAEAALKGVLQLKDVDFVLGGKVLRQSVASLCVRYGKQNRKLKAFKPKKA